MTIFDLARANLLSAQPLCFVLGALAVALRGDLKLPRQAFDTLAIYLMLAIGLRGGAELTELPFATIAGPALAALGLGVGIPIWCFAGLRWRGRYSAADAASLAAHYGSVSAVTFAASLAYTELIGAKSESFMPALLALMEAPAIIVSLALARSGGAGQGGIVAVLGEVLGGKSVLLLAGGLIVGGLIGPAGYGKVKPFFGDLFLGALCLFMLELGSLAASRLADIRKGGVFIVGFATLMPLLHGTLGVMLGHMAGLSMGGATVLGTLAASASYIAAPAAIRVGLPEANLPLSLAASLAITFPFNLILGLPIYAALAHWLAGG